MKHLYPLKKINQIIEEINRTFTVKRILPVIFLLVLFFALQNKIQVVISTYLLIPKDFSNLFLDLLLCSTSLYFVIYFYVKIFFHQYSLAYLQLVTIFGVVFVLGYYNLENTSLSWEFSSFYIRRICIKYVWLILIPLAMLIGFCLIRFFTSKLSAVNILSSKYFEDAPIDDSKHDKLGYLSIVNNLSATIHSQANTKSFIVGLIGPWGNGKSSIIGMTSAKLRKPLSPIQNLGAALGFPKRQDILIVHFLPYLNHKEEDIISEFFTSLSNVLSPYSGKLSNQILNYSERLTRLYKEKKVFDFMEPESTKPVMPSKSLYDDINCQLKQIGKKIVVFIDDLDRLNEKEILEVLKLIRNTADFYNTIFVVAMDKDYVLNRLKNNNKILDSRFVDKFFQLEIYLPELDKQVLRQYFIDEFRQSSMSSSSDFQVRLADALNNSFNLFETYIRNLRDAKRVINQITFDYPQFQGEIDLKDFMNFTFLKLKFPKIIKILNDHRDRLLKIDSTGKFYELKKLEDVKPENKFTGEMQDIVFRIQSNFFPIEKYQIYEQMQIKDISVGDFLNIDKEDFSILVRSLACLFGDENVIQGSDSIKFENNFRKLMQQHYLETDLLENEFKALYDNSKLPDDPTSPYDLPNEKVGIIFETGKIHELVQRLKYFNSRDIDEVKWSILLLGILFENRAKYSLNDNELFSLLEEFVERRIELNKNDNKAIGAWLINNFFERILSNENQLILYGEISKAAHKNNLWDIQPQFVAKVVLEKYQKFLSEVDEQQLNIHNFIHYRIYHSIKNVAPKESVNQVFKEHWNKNNVEFLCSQLTDFGSFSNNTFKLGDVTAEIFGSKDSFVAFVENLRAESEGVKEFLKLFRLLRIVNFSHDIAFKFSKSTTMMSRISTVRSYNTRDGLDDYDDIRQIFIQSNDKEVINLAMDDQWLSDNYQMKQYIFEESFFLLVHLSKKEGKKAIDVDFVQTFIKRVIPKTTWETKSFTLNGVTDFNVFYRSENKFIKVDSIQPPL